MKETTYQKIKRENILLKKQLKEVVLNPNSTESFLIKMNIRVVSDLVKVLYFNNNSDLKNQNGIFNQINNATNKANK